MQARTPFQLWTSLEEAFSRSGDVPQGNDRNHELFRSIVERSDARASEGYVLGGGSDPLLALRGLIFRGRLKAAAELAAQLAREANHPEALTEIWLEQARVHAMSGDWASAQAVCDVALAMSAVAPVSQLTLYQIRALARFERAQMMGAMEDIARTEALAALFPNCPSAFYAAILKARIVARDLGAEAGRARIAQLWTDLARHPRASLDRVHALVRAEIDVERVSELAALDPAWLVASYWLAERTGEQLYAALAAVECARAGDPALAAFFAPLARAGAEEFARVRRLCAELDAAALAGGGAREDGAIEGGVSVSAATIAASSAARADSPTGALATGALATTLARLDELERVVFVRHGIVLGTQPHSLKSIGELPQLLRSIAVLGGGPLPIPEFFDALWGHAKFAPHLHTSLVSSLFHRMKRRTGVVVRVARGSAALERTLVVP